MKTATRFLPLCSLLAMVIIAATAALCATAGGGQGSPLLPPNAHFRGKSLEEWNVLWVEWFVRTNLAGETDLPDTVKKTRLLPAAFVPGDYEFDITVPPGTGLVLPAMFIFGEIYADGSMDDPTFVFGPEFGDLEGLNILDYLYATTQTEVKLDGEVLLSGVASDLADYHFGPTYFDDPIFYEETQANNAVAAIWTFGVGAVYTPLSKGTHTMEVTTVFDNIFFGQVEFHYTYHIVVTK